MTCEDILIDLIEIFKKNRYITIVTTLGKEVIDEKQVFEATFFSSTLYAKTKYGGGNFFIFFS